MTRSIFSRSGSSVRGASGTVECVRLYWFCHVMGTEASKTAAEGNIPFLGGQNSLGAVLQRREVHEIAIEYLDTRSVLAYGSPLGLSDPLLDIELLPFGSVR
jgi:hypothetical protein